MTRIRISGVGRAASYGIVAVAAVLLIAGGSPAQGASHVRHMKVVHCPLRPIEGPLGIESVLSARHMSCRSARAVVRRYDDSVPYGSHHFRLGPFKCKVRHVGYEDMRAGCKKGRKAFGLDFGA